MQQQTFTPSEPFISDEGWVTAATRGISHSDDQLREIQEGQHVQIAIRSGRHSERFWVEVLSNKNDVIHGRVDNHLKYTMDHGIDYNDSVDIEYAFILDFKSFQDRTKIQ